MTHTPIYLGARDTIVATATAKGSAAIAIVRLSGEESLSVIDKIFPSKKISLQQTHTIHFGNLIFEGDVLDEVLVSVFKAPHSFTGENSAEINCHGAPYIVEKIITACVANGARVAKAGEFTQRAFLNKKIDLTQAEAVADLIASENKMSHLTAINHMRGGFSKKLQQLKQSLIEFAAIIELELDFSEEDIDFADRESFLEKLQQMNEDLRRLSSSFSWGNALKKGFHIAIIGKPNAGKSTLLNALLKEERAIVSSVPGTTRDTIEETLHYKNLTFRFIDTAGLRDTTDQIEQIGVKKAYQKMATADLILYLFDAGSVDAVEIETQEEFFRKNKYSYLLLANKIDTLPPRASLKERLPNLAKSSPYLEISALAEDSLEPLLEYVYTHFATQYKNTDTILTNQRHYEGLVQIQKNLTLIQSGIENHLSGDLLSVEIKQALYHIGELTGEVTNEHILDYVFRNFCIGK